MIIKQILSGHHLRNVRCTSGSLSKIYQTVTPSLPKQCTNPHQIRLLSSLPYHIVVGMPALSPTMEAGTLASWKVKEGDAFSAGDSVAEIETDKATIDFEAQDDGIVAKILKEAGTGEEIKVNQPIMVTVEEEEDVAAFADFTVPEEEPTNEPPASAPIPEPIPETPAPAVVAAETPPPPPPTPRSDVNSSDGNIVVDVTTEQESIASVSLNDTVSPSWGNFAKVTSPLAKTLSAKQHQYIKLYGSTGQIPL